MGQSAGNQVQRITIEWIELARLFSELSKPQIELVAALLQREQNNRQYAQEGTQR